MSSQSRRHKFFNLLRFGYRMGWIIPQKDGAIIVSENAPDHFQAKLHTFKDLFRSHEQAIALGKEEA